MLTINGFKCTILSIHRFKMIEKYARINKKLNKIRKEYLCLEQL